MTREQKIAKARELRAKGKSSGQIALVVGAPASTVRNWCLGGNCGECGTAVDGGSGDCSSRHCAACAPRANRKWSRERLLAKVREWVALYGEPPAGGDWHPSHPCATPEQRARFRDGEWPTSNVVRYHFSTWNAMIEAAGFDPIRVGSHRQQRQERVAA